MAPSLSPFIKRHPRRLAVRAALLVAVPVLVMALGAMGRPQARAHAPGAASGAYTEPAPSGSVGSLVAGEATPACAGSSCPLPHAVGPESSAPPAYAALDFEEAAGSRYSLPYPRVCGLSINAPRTVIVIEGPMYQAVVEGRNLESLYGQLQRQEIGTLKADSLANGETYSVPVVPLPTLMELGKAKLASLPEPEPVSEEATDAVSGPPFIGRVRVVLNMPFHFDGRSGAYVAEGGN